MEIVTPYAIMLSSLRGRSFERGDGIQLLQNIEYYARVSHRSEERITSDSYNKFLRSVVLSHGDWSVTEHEKVTVEAVVDRGITHEWVRHRLGSYTQESTRFVNYEKEEHVAGFIEPWPDRVPEQEEIDWWVKGIKAAEWSYRNMLTVGAKPQIARSVFPNALASKIIITYNLRGWRHFFLMRTSKETHPQMRQVSIPLLAQFQEKIPILYEDIVPNERQVNNMRLPR